MTGMAAAGKTLWRRLAAPWRLLRRELQDVVELWLIPPLAMVLPWPLAYRFFRLLVEKTPLYGREIPQCLANARHFLGSFDEQAFIQHQKMLRVLDHADYWLIRFRPQKASAITELEGVQGWPEAPGFLALCLHWGAGFLGIHHLRANGKPPLVVFLETPLSMRQQGVINVLYQKMRRRYYHKLSGGRALTTQPQQSETTGTRRLLKTRRHAVLMADVPARGQKAYVMRLKMNGRTFDYPVEDGFTRLITRRGRDYGLFSMAFDYPDGRRRLRIERTDLPDRQGLMRFFESALNRRLAEDPGQWQFWPVAHNVLRPTDAAGGNTPDVEEKTA